MASSAPGNGDANEQNGRPEQRIGRLNPDEITVADLLGREIGSGKVVSPPSTPGRRLAAGAGVVFVVGSMVAGAAVFGKTVPSNGTGEPPRPHPDSGFPTPPRPEIPGLPPRPSEPANPRGGIWAPGGPAMATVSPLEVLAPPSAAAVRVDLSRSASEAGSGRRVSRTAAPVTRTAAGNDSVVGDVTPVVGSLTNGVGGTVEKSANGVDNVLAKTDTANVDTPELDTSNNRTADDNAARVRAIEPANLRPAGSTGTARKKSIGRFGPASNRHSSDLPAVGELTEIVDLGGLL